MPPLPIHISPGNTKLGRVPNISTLPVRDCPPLCRKLCAKDCYALKAVRMYPATRKAWRSNGDAVRSDPVRACDAVRVYCQRKRPRLFRWHVAGDVMSRQHFAEICRVARACPGTRFLMFTKSYAYIAGEIPANLSIVFSIWPGMPRSTIPARLRRFPRAYAGDCRADPRFKRALHCEGHCQSCALCWHLKTIGRDVKFDMH